MPAHSSKAERFLAGRIQPPLTTQFVQRFDPRRIFAPLSDFRSACGLTPAAQQGLANPTFISTGATFSGLPMATAVAQSESGEGARFCSQFCGIPM